MKHGYRLPIIFSFIFSLVLLNPALASLPPVDSQGTPLPSLAPMLEKVTPAVVNIASQGTIRVQESPMFMDPFFRHFFEFPSMPRERKTQSLGSGVIVDAKNGYILTNNHVVDKADEITVTLRSGEHYQAKLIGTDPDTDIAVIQIEAKDLNAIPLGDSADLKVGDFAVAIGNPFGLGQTVTSGIISALERSGLGIEGYENFIQTDASINPGNSGGALVNLHGHLIGINTAIYSKSGGNIGIGFAIPINMAHSIMEQLIAHGKVERGRLGAEAQDLSPELAKAFDLSLKQGAVVVHVEKDSPADRAGLKPGDVVININDKPVKNSATLRNTVGLLRLGETVKLQVIRDGKELALTAQVEQFANANETAKGEEVHTHLAGTQLSNITTDSRLYGQVQGVLIAEVDPYSPAGRIGLQPGDVITSANRKEIKSIAQLKTVLKGKSSLMLTIRRGSASLSLFIQ